MDWQGFHNPEALYYHEKFTFLPISGICQIGGVDPSDFEFVHVSVSHGQSTQRDFHTWRNHNETEERPLNRFLCLLTCGDANTLILVTFSDVTSAGTIRFVRAREGQTQLSAVLTHLSATHVVMIMPTHNLACAFAAYFMDANSMQPFRVRSSFPN